MSNEQTSGESPVKAAQEHISSWESGWYVFEDGQVVGPLKASDAFARNNTLPSGQTRMISRKGFTQWYPIQDFASIYSMSGRYSDSLAGQDLMASESSGRPELVTKQIGPKFPAQQAAANKIQAVQRELSKNRSPAAESVSFMGNSANQSAVSPDSLAIKKLTRKEKKRLAEEERRSRKFAARQEKAARNAARAQNLIPSKTFEQQYLQVASRLRLGRIISPVLPAFIFAPITLGGYWWAWLSRSSEEISWHLNGSSRMNFVVPMWMCMIPGVHLILAYLVARMVRQMEEQNGYRNLSPAMATIAAIFPPFYMAMIQSALNRHWRLHVYHSAMS